MTSDQPVQLRRDAVPVLVCACSHIDVEHRCDLDSIAGKKRPCGRGGCGCAVMRPVERRWRLHGWLVEPIAG
jgi:hypothetical protein